MNKLLIDNSIKDIIINKANNDLVIHGKANIIILNNKLKKLNIKAGEGSEVIINDFRIINDEETVVNLEVSSSARIIYNHAYINNSSYNLLINTKYLSKEATIMVNVHGINDKGKSDILIEGLINKNNFDNQLYESVKIININGGQAVGIPNMLIHNSHVIANHNVTIGKIDVAELNYLMSKGISLNSAKKLILNGFIINVFDDINFITKIKEIINWR